jgi:ABC-2 type transport system permease protein
LAAATLGLLLLNSLFAAVGVFSSSLSSQPGLAAVICYGLLFLLSIISQAGQTPAAHIGLFDWLSWNEHLLPLLLGLVRTDDVLYFALLTAFFLLLAQRQLTNRRLG